MNYTITMPVEHWNLIAKVLADQPIRVALPVYQSLVDQVRVQDEIRTGNANDN